LIWKNKTTNKNRKICGTLRWRRRKELSNLDPQGANAQGAIYALVIKR